MRWRCLIRAGKPWPVFAAQCLLVLAVIVAGGLWLMARYEIGVARGKPCIPGKFYLIERADGRELEFKRGDLIVFKTDDRTQPFYRPGARFIKVVRGVAGDRVVIDAAGKVHVMGRGYYFASALEPPLVNLMGRKPRDFTADYPVEPGAYFVMGTLKDSFDSRYWGQVREPQVIGKALAVWGR